MSATDKQGGMRAVWVVLVMGVCAAMIIGKLPPAVPALQQELGAAGIDLLDWQR